MKHDLEKAKLVPEEQASYLYCDCCENFFETSGDLVGQHGDEGRNIPDFATPCHLEKLGLDATDIISCALRDHGFAEDAELEISEALYVELQEFLDAWCKKADVVNHFPDHGLKVDLRPAKEELAKETEATNGIV